ncbi:MAG: hypothetical protein LQ350_005529 [Teloschistes chrysophthalmus]|nr:MAG: hypothetical protein LQ350_005529 [Niorma chrysophthalma]
MREDDPQSISHTVSSVTDLPIPSQKEARDSQQSPSPKTPPILRKPSRLKHRPQDDIEVQSLPQGDHSSSPCMRQQLGSTDLTYLSQMSLQTQPHSVRLTELPVEVQEGVLDHLAGQLVGITVSSDAALKVKGTHSGFADCVDWFMKHPHLRTHVRHFEVWVPVWEVKASRRPTEIPPIPSAFTPRPDMRGTRANGRPAIVVQEISDMTQAFQQASHNVSLDEIFQHLRDTFPEAYALTIEGGQGKRTPVIKAGRDGNEPWPVINPKIGSLVVKGAWNIIREPSRFYLFTTAFPNLREYQCTYAKPKPQAYETMCCILKCFPTSITHLNMCLEGLTGKPPSSPDKWRSLYSMFHICTDIGNVLPDLETFSYTGRICGCLFTTACETAEKLRDTARLKSVDLIVRNCCRRRGGCDNNISGYNDATGIYQIHFINAFKKLVVEAVRALATFTALDYLRIRFLDLDSPNPLLNPYFHLQGDRVTGIWNDEILALLGVARPNASYDCLDVGDCGSSRQGEGEGEGFVDHILTGLVTLPRGGRPKSMNVDAYAALAETRV